MTVSVANVVGDKEINSHQHIIHTNTRILARLTPPSGGNVVDAARAAPSRTNNSHHRCAENCARRPRRGPERGERPQRGELQGGCPRPGVRRAPPFDLKACCMGVAPPWPSSPRSAPRCVYRALSRFANRRGGRRRRSRARGRPSPMAGQERHVSCLLRCLRRCARVRHPGEGMWHLQPVTSRAACLKYHLGGAETLTSTRSCILSRSSGAL